MCYHRRLHLTKQAFRIHSDSSGEETSSHPTNHQQFTEELEGSKLLVGASFRLIPAFAYMLPSSGVTALRLDMLHLLLLSHAQCQPKQIGFIMYDLHYTWLISYMGLYVKPRGKSILQYPLTLGVTLPIRRRIGVRMYEWSG